MRTFVSKGATLSHGSYSTITYLYPFQFQISTKLIVLEVYCFVILLCFAVPNHIMFVEMRAEKEVCSEVGESMAK